MIRVAELAQPVVNLLWDELLANPVVHWGTGVHLCAGMHLARLEMEVMLEALIECDAHLTVGEPTLNTNRGLYGFSRLPLRID